MTKAPCSARTFPLRISTLSRGVLVSHASWLKHLSERLGPPRARALWEAALERYDLPRLDAILASGWTPIEEAEVHANEAQDSAEDHSASATALEWALDRQGLPNVREAPPIARIRSRFADRDMERETTTYEALHMFMHGRALLAEALLDQYGKQGELIAYDIVTQRRCAAVPAHGRTISAFMRRGEDSPGTRNMFTAGLEIEVVHNSPTEDVFLVRHCEWARYFRENHPQVGYLMACSTDEAFARAWHPSLRMQRTRTLMEGGEFCDFRYYVAEEAPDPRSGAGYPPGPSGA